MITESKSASFGACVEMIKDNGSACAAAALEGS
jgi:hypothetical protein